MGLRNARENTTQQTDYLRKRVVLGDAGKTVTVGFIPAGALVVRGGVAVITAYNAGTANTINVGVTGTPAGYTSAQSLTTPGFAIFNALATSTVVRPANAIEVTATLTNTGTAATTGEAEIVVEFIPNNDRY